MNDSEKLNRIYVVLTDPEIGLCARVKKLERTVNGNGAIGLAEEVRALKGRWALMVTGGTLAVSALFNLLPELARFIAKKTGG